MARGLSMYPNGGSGEADLHLDENGNLAIADGIEDVRQRVIQALRFLFGEWFLDTQKGLPWHQEILTRPVALSLASSLIAEHVLAVNGVAEVISVELQHTGLTRHMTGRVRVRSTEGIETNVEAGIG